MAVRLIKVGNGFNTPVRTYVCDADTGTDGIVSPHFGDKVIIPDEGTYIYGSDGWQEFTEAGGGGGADIPITASDDGKVLTAQVTGEGENATYAYVWKDAPITGLAKYDDVKVVDELPSVSDAAEDVLYVYSGESYILKDNAFIKIGITSADLDDYMKISTGTEGQILQLVKQDDDTLTHKWVTLKSNNAFPSNLVTNSTFDALAKSIVSATITEVGTQFLGEVSCLNWNSSEKITGTNGTTLNQCEIAFQVINSAGNNSKVIHFDVYSADTAPYHWTCMYWDNAKTPWVADGGSTGETLTESQLNTILDIIATTTTTTGGES